MEGKGDFKTQYGDKGMVKVGFLEDEPAILAALGVKISQTPFEKGTIKELYEECKKEPKKSKELVNQIMKNHRHLILGDFLPYAITLEDLSRFAALYFWRSVNCHNLVFGAGIEASLRVLKPNRHNPIVSELGKTAFETYQRLLQQGIPNQDAKYVLPEGTLTRMIFSAPPRYLMKIANALMKTTSLSELQEIGQKIALLIEDNFGLEIPEEPLPSEWKFWGGEEIEERVSLDDTKNIYSTSLNMGIRGSLTMYAQLVRQRLLLCAIEPLEGIARLGSFVIPPTFPQGALEDYRAIALQAKEKQMELIEKKDPNFVYFLLLGQGARANIYAKGSGVLEHSKARSCGVAQWEIRNVVGIPLTRALATYEVLRREIGPRCWRQGICLEPATFKTKKNVCPVFAQGWKEKSLEELLELLSELYKTFEF